MHPLNSKRTTFNHENYAFASEFAATEIRYRTGASVDDIICDPCLASEFDRIAMKMASGYAPLRYRWALLSIRKAGRKALWLPEYEMPKLAPIKKLFSDDFDEVPKERGVYVLYENERALYVRGSNDVRHGLALHREPEFFEPIHDKLWQPNRDAILYTYAALPEAKLLRPVEQRLIREARPLFNLARAA